MVAKTI